MTSGRFDDLVSRMSEVAEVVNEFESEEIQLRAFEVLIRAWVGDESTLVGQEAIVLPLRDEDTSEPNGASDAKDSQRRESETRPPRRRKASNPTPSLVRDLDLSPVGKTSLRDFVGQYRAPKNQNERNLLAVAYLEDELHLEDIGMDHVHTCYRTMAWTNPGNLYNSLVSTGSKVGWIDTSRMAKLTVSPIGRNQLASMEITEDG